MWSDTVQNLIVNPGPCGRLEGAAHYGAFGVPGEGPYFVLWLAVGEAGIQSASFDTYGCVAALATGTLLVRLLVGRTLAQVEEITAKDLTLLLGGLPEGKGHIPDMAITALKQALQSGV